MRPDPSHGVFETLLIRNGRVQALTAHLDRLAASVSELYGARLPAHLAEQVLGSARSLTGAHRMRVDAVPEAAEARIAVSTSALAQPGTSAMVAVAVTIAGGLGRHKWCDRRQLDAFAAQAGPNRLVLICDDDGQVLEGAWATVWLLRGDCLLTPPADGRILPGVTRTRLIELAPSLGLQAIEGPIALPDIQRARAVFLTSSLRVVAITTSDRPSFRIDPQITAIAQALAAGHWS